MRLDDADDADADADDDEEEEDDDDDRGGVIMWKESRELSEGLGNGNEGDEEEGDRVGEASIRLLSSNRS